VTVGAPNVRIFKEKMCKFVNMTREELFKYIQQINDPLKDFGKILSTLHFTHYDLLDKYKKILQNYDLTLTQSNVLGIIAYHYPNAVSLEEIKAMVLEPNADVSRTVVRLTDKGFVEKITNLRNRRKVCIKATSKGLKITKKIDAAGKFQEFTKNLSLAEAKTLIRLLRKIRLEKA
jgi:DNA-binding MarR family transcriptional regulator